MKTLFLTSILAFSSLVVSVAQAKTYQAYLQCSVTGPVREATLTIPSNIQGQCTSTFYPKHYNSIMGGTFPAYWESRNNGSESRVALSLDGKTYESKGIEQRFKGKDCDPANLISTKYPEYLYEARSGLALAWGVGKLNSGEGYAGYVNLYEDLSCSFKTVN